jgi:hypothetical protein
MTDLLVTELTGCSTRQLSETKKPSLAKMHGPAWDCLMMITEGGGDVGRVTAITTSSTVTQISMAEEAIIDATQVTI